jgi:ankyrin repeat protein
MERSGREIGRELVRGGTGSQAAETMGRTLTALGFAPQRQRGDTGQVVYRLGNCPYREAALEKAVCTLYRGLTRARSAPALRAADQVRRRGRVSGDRGDHLLCWEVAGARIGLAREGAPGPRRGMFPPRTSSLGCCFADALFGATADAGQRRWRSCQKHHERSITLPAVERVEYHRKEAKELLRAARAGQLDAVSRLRDALGNVPGELRLADAQRAIAREHGHRSWAAFRRDLEGQAGEPVRSVARLGPVDPARFEPGAARLLRMLASGDRRALDRLRAHVPRLAGRGDAALSQRATIADARLVIAGEYGFPTWRKLLEGLRAETAAWRHSRQHSEPVAAALDAIRAGDAGSLRRRLCSHPELVHVEVGAGGSLLGEVAQPDVFGISLGHALGVDRACVDVLIELGSDLDAPLNLAACFDRVELVQILLAAGARADATGIWGITPLETAIYHASTAAADVLAAITLVPDALWVAAGAGRVDRLERFLDGRGGLLLEAYQHRPNPADIGWLHRLPARDIPQDVLDEALVHAAQNERPEAVAWLLDHGADPNAGPYQGCGALHLAAAFGALESVQLLIAAGADIERTNDFNGDNALGWAEYVLARERPSDASVAAVTDLLRSLGSRPAVWGAPSDRA